MKTSARAAALTDTAVIELAKRIQRKRAILADNPLLAAIAPSQSGQGFLRRLGLGKVDIALSPEITLAKLVKEWRSLDRHYESLAPYGDGSQTMADKVAGALKNLNSRIGLVEYRVFGANTGPAYPQFTDPVAWLAWRLQVAHPEHGCGNASAGWKPELFAYALEESHLSF